MSDENIDPQNEEINPNAEGGHTVLYGICQNKCFVPVSPKTDTDAVANRVGTLETEMDTAQTDIDALETTVSELDNELLSSVNIDVDTDNNIKVEITQKNGTKLSDTTPLPIGLGMKEVKVNVKSSFDIENFITSITTDGGGASNLPGFNNVSEGNRFNADTIYFDMDINNLVGVFAKNSPKYTSFAKSNGYVGVFASNISDFFTLYLAQLQKYLLNQRVMDDNDYYKIRNGTYDVGVVFQVSEGSPFGYDMGECDCTITDNVITNVRAKGSGSYIDKINKHVTSDYFESKTYQVTSCKVYIQNLNFDFDSTNLLQLSNES